MADMERLEARVRVLEDKVLALRASRRVLLSLLSTMEQDRKLQVSALEQELKRTRLRAHRYARRLRERGGGDEMSGRALP